MSTPKTAPRSMSWLGLIVTAGVAAAPAASAGCQVSSSCTEVAILRPMTYDAVVPSSADASMTTLEICFGQVCDTSRLTMTSSDPVCVDVDGKTASFPTQCTFHAASRTLSLSTDTVYGGHAGSDVLVLTAIAPSGQRAELLRGNVSYADTSDDAARAACTTAWQGTFTKQ